MTNFDPPSVGDAPSDPESHPVSTDVPNACIEANQYAQSPDCVKLSVPGPTVVHSSFHLRPATPH